MSARLALPRVAARLLALVALAVPALGAPALAQHKAGAAPAARKAAPAAPERPSATSVTRSFAELGTGREPLRLTTWQAGYSVKVPIAPREIVTGVRMRLVSTNSTALIKSRSELSVRVNGQVIAQYALDPQDTSHSRDIELPLALLKVGYNDVFIGVVQHYTYDCEDPASPELWTEVNPLQSSVTVDVAGLRPNLAPRLTQLHLAFDERAWLARPLSVVTATEHVSDVHATAAALAVQGLALRLGPRPLAVQVYGAATAAAIRPENTRFPGLSSAVVQGRDVLLVGRRSELSRYLDNELYALTGAGAFVGVFAAREGDSVVLVVSGNTDEELLAAARSITEPGFKFNDVAMESVRGSWPFVAPVRALPGVPMAFSKFGFRTSGARGLKVQPIRFEFRAPADYAARKGDLASLRLHFSHGAGIRPDSSLVVRLNGHFAVSVALTETAGAEYQKYEVRVPAQFIRPGYNEIVFEPVFLTHKDRCEMVRDEAMVLTLYEDSTLELARPSLAPYAPDLARFAASFWPLDERMRLYLTQRDTATVSAALTFIAQAAQMNRAPFEVDVAFAPYPEGHLLALGPHGALAPELARALPLERYAWSAESAHVGLAQGVQNNRVVTALTAQDSATLASALLAMKSKGLWSLVGGAASVIDLAQSSVVNEPATERTAFGAAKTLALSVSNWKVLTGLTALFAIVFTAAFLRLLRTRAKRRRDEPKEQGHA